jgi:hypothetical protein
MIVLRKSISNIILILTYPQFDGHDEDNIDKNATKLLYSCFSQDMFSCDIYNTVRLLSAINFCKFLQSQKELEKELNAKLVNKETI